jgi:signal transduction histidine kinase
MRATFFSSVAHELRTPLNSMIPILKMVLDQVQQLATSNTNAGKKLLNYIQIALNSSTHLQSVIEDALDISRIENNNFTLFMETFDIRAAVNQVCDIMNFQLEQKNLKLELAISQRVPARIYSDMKRFKQILFNLIGNAVKFTFSGQITVRLEFEESAGTLSTEVEDTGIGIKPEDLVKLFRFFGCLENSKDIN